MVMGVQALLREVEADPEKTDRIAEILAGAGVEDATDVAAMNDRMVAATEMQVGLQMEPKEVVPRESGAKRKAAAVYRVCNLYRDSRTCGPDGKRPKQRVEDSGSH